MLPSFLHGRRLWNAPICTETCSRPVLQVVVQPVSSCRSSPFAYDCHHPAVSHARHGEGLRSFPNGFHLPCLWNSRQSCLCHLHSIPGRIRSSWGTVRCSSNPHSRSFKCLANTDLSIHCPWEAAGNCLHLLHAWPSTLG